MSTRPYRNHGVMSCRCARVTGQNCMNRAWMSLPCSNKWQWISSISGLAQPHRGVSQVGTDQHLHRNGRLNIQQTPQGDRGYCSSWGRTKMGWTGQVRQLFPVEYTRHGMG